MRYIVQSVFLLLTLIPIKTQALCTMVSCLNLDGSSWVACRSDGGIPSGNCDMATSLCTDAAGTCGVGPSPTFGCFFDRCPTTEVGACTDGANNDAWVAGDAGTDCADADCAADATCRSRARCLSRRAKATGKYEQCVQKWLATVYGGADFSDNTMSMKLSKCREKYQKAWDKLVGLGVAPCSGSRWVDNGNGTVTDNLTDLVWEKKTDDGGIHDWDNSYTWSTGSPWAGKGTAFTSFLSGLNGGGGFAGANDWRLPTFAELLSILVQPFPCTTSPCVDSAFGSYTQSSLDYRSATTVASDPSQTWDVSFDKGEVNDFGKALSTYVRAVRGGS